MKKRLILVMGDHGGGPGFIVDSLIKNLKNFDEIKLIALKRKSYKYESINHENKLHKIKIYGFYDSIKYLLGSFFIRKDKNIIFSFDNLGLIYGFLFKFLTNSLLVISLHGFKGPVSKKYFFINKFIIHNFSDKLIVNTKSLKRFIKAFFEKSEPMVIYNGIRFSKVQKINNKNSYNYLESRKLNIIHLANFYSTVKGHKTSLDILNLLLKKGIDVRLNFVGDGALINQIKAYSKDKGLQQYVYFHGYLDESEKIKQIRKNDICLNPSSTESFGIGALECMSQGLPVVGSDVPGFNELVLSDYNGILCDKDKVITFVEAIEYLIKNPRIYKEYSLNSQKQSLLFSEDRMINSYSNLFNKLLKNT